jgi:uncharacterized protein YjbI with pentapeptide repeats
VEYKDALTPLESRLVECAAAGDELDCAPTGATAAELDEIDDWDDRKIRAWVLVALCTGEMPDGSVHPRRGLRLRGAYIAGQVDLSRAQMTQCPLAFHTCRFEEHVVLYQATTSDLSFTSCALPSLYGDGFNSSASLNLTETNLRQMSFGGASFRGVVLLSEVRLINPGGYALYADGMSASDIFLRDTHIEGDVRLVGANLSGKLSFSEGTKLINPDGLALGADGMNARDVFLSDTYAEGELSLSGANISGQLKISGRGIKLINPDGPALSLAYAQIGTLADDLASWPDTYNLVGFSYQSLGGDENLDRRLRWIGNSKPFSPRVYSQLAEVYRRSGHEGFARQVELLGGRKSGGGNPISAGGYKCGTAFLALPSPTVTNPGEL